MRCVFWGKVLKFCLYSNQANSKKSQIKFNQNQNQNKAIQGSTKKSLLAGMHKSSTMTSYFCEVHRNCELRLETFFFSLFFSVCIEFIYTVVMVRHKPKGGYKIQIQQNVRFVPISLSKIHSVKNVKLKDTLTMCTAAKQRGYGRDVEKLWRRSSNTKDRNKD